MAENATSQLLLEVQEGAQQFRDELSQWHEETMRGLRELQASIEELRELAETTLGEPFKAGDGS
jgi:hypothetical protein